MFLPITIFFIFNEKFSFFQRNLYHFSVYLFIFISFWLFWTVLGGFGEIYKSKMADQCGRRLEINYFPRHVTSSAHDADLKGNNFRRTIHPQSFIVVTSIFSELDRGASGAPLPPPPFHPVQEIEKKPGLDRVKAALPKNVTNFDFCNGLKSLLGPLRSFWRVVKKVNQ